MPSLRLIFRLLVAGAIGVAVFFASMALTLAVRGQSPLAASSPEPSRLVSEISPGLVAPLLSTESVAVATTDPSTPVVATAATVVIPTRTRSAPLPELDDVFTPLVSDLDSLLDVPIRVPAEFSAAGGELVADGSIDGEHDVVVSHEDGSSTIFAVDENRPRAIIDLRTSERLLVTELVCTWWDGEHVALDAATNEQVNFVSTLTVTRTALSQEALDQPRWNC